MYFTLGISAATRQGCAALVAAALDTDVRVMPIAGPPGVAWQASDECTAVLHWGHRGNPGSDDHRVAASHAGTIWISPAGQDRAPDRPELFRRMTTRRLELLHPAAAAPYLASLAPSAAALAGGPLRALDDFYLVNRAGRWSAAARQAYLIRAPLVQPFFADRVVRAARAVPLRQRIGDQLHRDVLAELCPELLRIPLASQPWQGEARTAEMW